MKGVKANAQDYLNAALSYEKLGNFERMAALLEHRLKVIRKPPTCGDYSMTAIAHLNNNNLLRAAELLRQFLKMPSVIKTLKPICKPIKMRLWFMRGWRNLFVLPRFVTKLFV